MPAANNLHLLYRLAGEILATNGQPEKAIELLERGIRTVPANCGLAYIYRALARVLAATNKSDAAAELLRQGTLRVAAQDQRILIELSNNIAVQAAVEPSPPESTLLDAVLDTGEVKEFEPAKGDSLEETGQFQPNIVPAFDAERILRALRPDGWYGLYVLGCYDVTKTLYVQQCRALTLIHALFEMGELQPGRRLGIVGGGAAGVTAAAAAAIKGVNVILFERSESLLSLQHQNTKRYIHPHAYDWPFSGAEASNAGLPLLDWHADTASKVAAQIIQGFDDVRAKVGKRIDVRLGRAIQDILRVESSELTDRIRIVGSEGDINEIVDVAILAIGFGIEPKRPLGIEAPAYWEDDGLDQSLGATSEKPKRVLVSGSGDGALIDLLRASLRNFDYRQIFEILPRSAAMQKIKEQLIKIETTARRTAVISLPGSVNIHQNYNRLDLTDLQTLLLPEIRKETDVWFNFESLGRYTLRSSVLNRLLVSTLSSMNVLKPKRARLEERAISRYQANEWLVTWPNGETQIFDQIVVRHGPPMDYLGSVFPELGEACAPLRGKLRELDLAGKLDEDTRRYFS